MQAIVLEVDEQTLLRPSKGYKRFWANVDLWRAQGRNARVYVPNADQLDDEQLGDEEEVCN